MTALMMRAMRTAGPIEPDNKGAYHDFLLTQTDLDNDDDGLGQLLAERPELVYDKNKTYVVDHGSA